MDDNTKEVWMEFLEVADRAIEAHNNKIAMIGGTVVAGIVVLAIAVLIYTW